MRKDRNWKSFNYIRKRTWEKPWERTEKCIYMFIHVLLGSIYTFFWDYFSVFHQNKADGRIRGFMTICAVFELVHICLPMKRNSSLLRFKLLFLSIFCGLKIFYVPSDKRAVKKRSTALQIFQILKKQHNCY